MILLDTNIIIYLLEGKLAELPDSAQVCVSVITEIELLSHHRLNAAGERAIRELIARVAVVDLTPPIKEQAIVLRRQHRLTVPDAIIVGTAVSLDAELITNDTRLSGLPDVRSRSLPMKS